MEPDLVGDVVKLFTADLVKLFPSGLQLLGDLDRLLGHRLVGFLGASHQRKILALGKALMAVGIQPNTEQKSLS